MRKVGFTGTSGGMTTPQVMRVLRLLASYAEPIELHHGDCVGADAEVHECALALSIRIVLHPPNKDHARAFCTWSNEIRDPATYLTRNRHIVDETESLIAAPGEFTERLRSGTWATIRRARKAGKRVAIVWPNGETQHERNTVSDGAIATLNSDRL